MRFFTIYKHWFENQASTQHVSTWADICNSLRIDDEPEDISKLILSVHRVRYDLPIYDTGGRKIFGVCEEKRLTPNDGIRRAINE